MIRQSVRRTSTSRRAFRRIGRSGARSTSGYGGFAPGSPGAKSGRPSGYGSAVRIGQVFDVLTPIVRQHPEWFRWVERDVTLADLDRLERLEGVE